MRFRDLEDSQLQTTFLRSCLYLPKFNFALRTCPPSVILMATSAFDASVREALEDITGGPLSDWAWLKANLPCSLGGLNLWSAALHAPAAYISSIVNSLDLVSLILGYTPNLPLALSSAISSLARITTWCSLEDIDVPLQQKSLSCLVHEACFNTLVESAPDVRSRPLSSSLPHVGDWLNVIQFPTLGLCLLDQEFRLCLNYWLGLRMADNVSSCSACGESAADDLIIKWDVGATVTAIQDALFSAAQAAALAPRKEVPSLIPGTRSCPADIFLPN